MIETSPDIRRAGFTLIELSIVLVIIALIIGGVLVGRDLIKASQIRAQVSQIESFNTAANTFKAKYNCLPGDCKASTAAAIGMMTRSGAVGNGDGNGYIDALSYNPAGATPYKANAVIAGEILYFWRDLSSAQMISDKFNDPTTIDQHPTTEAGWSALLPKAMLGYNLTYVTVYGHSLNLPAGNYFQIINPWTGGTPSWFPSVGAISPFEAAAIDQKVDDGLPLIGNVVAMQPDYVSGYSYPGESVAALSPTYNLCVQTGTPVTYNTNTATTNSSRRNCSLALKASF